MALFKNDVIRVKFALMKLGFLKPYKNQSVDEWDTEAKEAYRAFQIADGTYPRQAADAPHSMNGLHPKLAAILGEGKAELEKILNDIESAVKSVQVKTETVEASVEAKVEKKIEEVETAIKKGIEKGMSSLIGELPEGKTELTLQEELPPITKSSEEEKSGKKKIFSIF